MLVALADIDDDVECKDGRSASELDNMCEKHSPRREGLGEVSGNLEECAEGGDGR